MRALAFFLAIAGTLGPAAAVAAPDSPAADVAARRALEDQRYDEALALVHEELASPRAGVRASALAIAAEALLLAGRPADAAPYVDALYELAPAFELDDASLPPRVTEAFAAAAARPHARAVALTLQPKEGPVYELTLSQRAATVDVACRAQPTGGYSPATVSRFSDTRFAFRLPTVGEHDCFVVAADLDALPLGRLGSRVAPVAVRPQPPRASKTVLTRWWFWTAAGAAVAGGVALVYLETRPRDVSLPSANAMPMTQALRW